MFRPTNSFAAVVLSGERILNIFTHFYQPVNFANLFFAYKFFHFLSPQVQTFIPIDFSCYQKII